MSGQRLFLIPGSCLATVLTALLAAVAAAPDAKEGDAVATRQPTVESPFSPEERSHWAYQQVRRPRLPQVKDARWTRNPIDAFILARLEQSNLSPSSDADRRTLIRRATMDLHGLPPTPEEVEAFVSDPRDDAYEQLVDRLLTSPRYGERWARHWLDLVRYAESDGYKADVTRKGAWRYRDYVIRALNNDKPYDRFVAEQLAGDELWPESADAAIATGFLRHWPYEDNGRDLDRQWTAILNDVTDVTGQVFMGMTVRCARCHDHKFDAILQKDYYRLQAFFGAMTPRDDVPIGPAGDLSSYYVQVREWEDATRELRAERDKLAGPYQQQAEKSMGSFFPPFVQEILDTAPEERTPYERQLVILAGKMLKVDRKKMAERMKGDVRKRWDELSAKIANFDSLRPREMTSARGVRDVGPVASPTRIPDAEDHTDILPGGLTVLDPAPLKIPSIANNPRTTGRRAALARWMTDPRKNPLVARVMVNRLWQHHFVVGVVGTPGDFGVMGDSPSHEKLLDWLAAELVDRRWSLKAMHRLMVTSATYRQASVVSPAAAGFEVDPDNKLLWRMNSRRIEAEVMRDSMLAVAGQLHFQMYGASVLPKLPAGLTQRYAWKPTPGEDQQRRRSIYLVVKRNTHLPLLKTFDVPDSHDTCMRRVKTTTPTQALILLNDNWPLERARDMAGRLLRDAGGKPADLVRRAYEVAYNRPPLREELRTGRKFLRQQAKLIDKPKVLPTGGGDDVKKRLAAALVDYCHALLNTNEFIYID